ncbi:MAG TPA: hypothetical protein DCQ14_03785, partial [Firmicutes bacterium]|nr:hypothetical protein [Bacillota bacterium]
LGRTLSRKGTARAAVENVLTALTALLQKNMRNYDIHLNFPGGVPVDGPSAGVGAALAIYSAGQSSHHRQCRKDLREKSGQKKLVKGGA